MREATSYLDSFVFPHIVPEGGSDPNYKKCDLNGIKSGKVSGFFVFASQKPELWNYSELKWQISPGFWYLVLSKSLQPSQGRSRAARDAYKAARDAYKAASDHRDLF